MAQTLKILIVEDSKEDVELLLRELKRGGYEPVYEQVDDLASMTAALQRQSWDLIVLDHSMPHFSPDEAQALLQQMGIGTPFVLVSGTIGEDAGVEAMKAGAQDYIFKGNLKRFLPVVERTLRESAERDRLKARVEKITGELKARSQQQEIVAVIGQLALSGTHPALLMNDIVYIVAQTLKADLGLFLELLPDDRTLLLRAGFGWHDETIGRFSFTAQDALNHGFAFLSSDPVVFEDLYKDQRFQPFSFLLDYGLVSGLSVGIWGQHRSSGSLGIYGTLGVYTKKRRKFIPEDVNFLQAIANILAAALDRTNLEGNFLKKSG